MSRRFSPLGMALLGLAASLGAAARAAQEMGDSAGGARDIVERMARQQAKRERRAMAVSLSMRPRDPIPGTKAHRRAHRPGRCKR